MVYKSFLETVTSRLQILMGTQAEVSLRQIPKNNGVILDGLCISRPESSVAPAIYLNGYYEQFQAGVSIDSIISDILAVYQENSHPDETRFRNFSSLPMARRHLVFRLISTEANEDFLQTVPHLPFLDLSIVFYLLFDDGTTCFSSSVDNEQLQRWNMKPEELLPLARANSLSLLPPVIRSMTDVVRDMAMAHMGEEYDPDWMESLLAEQRSAQPLYILTNTAELNGAGCILYPGQLKKFADAAGSDLIVLPSSIHEVLLTPDRGFSHYSSLNTMVSQINEEEVRREDRLADHIYLYSRENNCLLTPEGDWAPVPA